MAVRTTSLVVIAGADPKIPDGKGVMPLTLEKRHGFAERLKTLEKADARP